VCVCVRERERERERERGEGLRHGIVLCVSYVGNNAINGLTYNIYDPYFHEKSWGLD